MAGRRMSWDKAGSRSHTRTLLRGTRQSGTAIHGATPFSEVAGALRKGDFNTSAKPKACHWCERAPLYMSGFDKKSQKFFGACKAHKHLLPPAKGAR